MLYNYTRGRFLENRRESDKVRNHSLKDIPQDYVQKEQNPDNGATVYNLSFVNKASLRDYSS